MRDVELPKPVRAPGGHLIYLPNQDSDCPRHRFCAYDGTERRRCPVCHVRKSVGCEHTEA
jgi:hypothetical protein